jgi:hypothetical protein
MYFPVSTSTLPPKQTFSLIGQRVTISLVIFTLTLFPKTNSIYTMSFGEISFQLTDAGAVIQGLLDNKPSQTIQISKKTGEITPFEGTPFTSTKYFGFLGSIKLLSGTYVFLVKERREVCKLINHVIYTPTKVEIISLDPKKMTELSTEQKNDEGKYVELLQNMLAEKSFYYSHTLDLTTNFQTLFQSGKFFDIKTVIGICINVSLMKHSGGIVS